MLAFAGLVGVRDLGEVLCCGSEVELLLAGLESLDRPGGPAEDTGMQGVLGVCGLGPMGVDAGTAEKAGAVGNCCSWGNAFEDEG